MDWTYENLELDEAYEELGERIGHLIAIRNFLIDSVTDDLSDKIKSHVWKLDDKASVEAKKLIDVHKALGKIRRCGS